MCGRVFSRLDISDISQRTQSMLPHTISNYKTSYNLGPARYLAALLPSSKLNCSTLVPNESSSYIPSRALVAIKWGISAPRRSSSSKQPLTNIRSETALQYFPRRMNNSRCIIIAEGYYEWRAKDKTPFAIRRKGSDLVYFAGVYEMSSQGEMEFAVITLESIEDMTWLHERMPAMLDENEIDDWINPENMYQDVQKLIRPRRESELRYYEVPKLVGNIKNDRPECCMTIQEFNERSKNTGIMRFFTPAEKRKAEGHSPTKRVIPKPTEESKR
jgi:putative SOS response-associated peptidase YedK